MVIYDHAVEVRRYWPTGSYVLRDALMTTFANAAEAQAFACTKPEIRS